VSARTGWPAIVVRESYVNGNDWSCGFEWKSEHGNVIVTTGGHGGPPLRGNRSRYTAPGVTNDDYVTKSPTRCGTGQCYS
jgi:hypothetical protein